MTVELDRRGQHPPRTVTLNLRAVAVTLRPPRKRSGPEVPVTVIRATEVGSEPAVVGPPIDWQLTTTLPAASVEGARLAVRRYTQRWLIERYHYTLKQGCAVERLQLATVERLERALALYAMVAWHVLWLTYLGRHRADEPASLVVSPEAWAVLWAVVQPGQSMPARPPTVEEVVRLIARLGGFLARSGDGAPGVRVLWRGWRRFQDILIGTSLAPPLAPSGLLGNE